ncbi:CHASE2 domain-containing protein [candidate division KSB1 bacterium]
MAENKQKIGLKKTVVQLTIGLSIALVVVFLSWFSKSEPDIFPFYEIIELKLLDQRYLFRGEVYMDPVVATIDIDAFSLGVEGRYQDWTREKYANVNRALKELNARMIGYDIYFVEKSKFVLSREVVDNSYVSSDEEFRDLLVDFDEELRLSMAETDMVILGQTFEVAEPQDPDWVELNTVVRDSVKEESVRGMEKYYLEHQGWREDNLVKYMDIEPPMADLIDDSRGAGFAMTVTDIDGSVRHYPVVLVYDRKIWPSLSLMMILDYIGADFKDVEIVPGEEIILPPGRLPDGAEINIRIPIDDKGLMMVNWAGDYHSENFFHIPHTAILKNKTQWHQAAIARKVKKIFNDDPEAASEPGQFLELAPNYDLEINEETGLIYDIIRVGFQIEEAIEQDMIFDKEEVGEVIYEIYEQILLNRTILDLFASNPELSLTDAAHALERPENDIRRSYFIMKDKLDKGGVKPEDHPLYFYDPELNGRILTEDDFRDKVFFYGLTAAGTWDLNPMPYNERYPMLGLHANIFNTILTRNFLKRVDFEIDILILLFFGLLTGILIPRIKPLTGGILIFMIMAGYLVFAQYVFEAHGLWIDVFGAVTVILLGYTIITVYNFFSEEKEKKMIRGIFSRYVTKSVVDELIKNPDMVKLGGEKKKLTVFFSDVAGFTTLSEAMTPEELVSFLNEYLTSMTNIILRYDGMIDKYEGDAIMAVFGTPIFYEDHAARACAVSIEMQEELEALREKWKNEGKPEIRVRIGLNTGEMVAGNMGALDRLDYTVMGDSVNLGSRLESANKQYGTYIMISEYTYEIVKDKFETRFLDSLKVKGKTLPVKVYELIGKKEVGLSGEMEEAIKHYNTGMENYLAQKWDDGIENFNKVIETLGKDEPSSVYIERCSAFKENPPPENWDGVFTMTTK